MGDLSNPIFLITISAVCRARFASDVTMASGQPLIDFKSLAIAAASRLPRSVRTRLASPFGASFSVFACRKINRVFMLSPRWKVRKLEGSKIANHDITFEPSNFRTFQLSLHVHIPVADEMFAVLFRQRQERDHNFVLASAGHSQGLLRIKGKLFA